MLDRPTTRAEANAVLTGATDLRPTAAEDNIPVDVLVMHGIFAALAAPPPGLPALPPEHYLLLVVDQASGAVLDAGVMPTAPSVAGLGSLTAVG